MIREMGFEAIEEMLLRAARPSIRVETTAVADEGDIPIGASKIGGRPDLPRTMSWVTVPDGEAQVSLPFIAQFDLKDIKPYDEENLLPAQGWLFFFGDPWLAPEHADHGRVIYFDGDSALLERKAFPDDIPHVEPQGWGNYLACSLAFIPEVNLPTHDADWVTPTYPEGKTWRDFSRLVAAASYPHPTPPITQTVTRLLGYNHDIPEDLQTECQLIADTGSPYEASPEDLEQAEEHAHEWQLLFQMASDRNAGMMWSDMGDLCFYIRRDDLRKQQFEKAIMVFFST